MEHAQFLQRVYPRVCGGTQRFWIADTASRGLSPRMRGNHVSFPGSLPGSRSIPAYAGEPRDWIAGMTAVVVYPRVCGGTSLRWPHERRARGLSPRMRGNHFACGGACGIQWSIPAYAGEPRRWRRRRPWCAVYPRVCGGTKKRTGVAPSDNGLSPRMRGNLGLLCDAVSAGGSIPAYAGEPAPLPGIAAFARVYPRVCGGTWLSAIQRHDRPGLSPRMRGNRGRLGADLASVRSIPAYAGEPVLTTTLDSSSKVYPRVCGGTRFMNQDRSSSEGLSPRMRGNLRCSK